MRSPSNLRVGVSWGFYRDVMNIELKNFQFARGRELGDGRTWMSNIRAIFQFARGRELGVTPAAALVVGVRFQFARGRELGVCRVRIRTNGNPSNLRVGVSWG